MSIKSVSYGINRFTIDVRSTPEEFRSQYEEAVPPLPRDEVMALVARQARWQEMLELVTAAAPFGFLIYAKNEVDPVMRLAGDNASCASYLMGNHTIAERMFRYEPAAMLYAPLHTVIWGPPDGSASFTFDRPSDQFASFANRDIATVGVELDRKLAALLDHLAVSVPDELLTSQL